jgi:hypothetical protein
MSGEREADDEITAGRGTVHEAAEDMFAHLDSLGSADESGPEIQGCDPSVVTLPGT